MASILLSPALSDAAIVTGAATSGDLTITNLLTMQPGETCRFASLGSMYAEFDFGSAVTLDYIWARSPNISSAGTVRLRMATSQANLTASPGYDPGAVTAWTATGSPTWPYHDTHINLLSNPQTYRWMRLDWADAANLAGYLDISRVYAGRAYQCPNGVDLQSLGPTAPVLRVTGQGGQVYPVVRPAKNTTSFTVLFTSRADALGALFDLGRLRGTSKDMLAVLETAETTNLQPMTIYGLADEPFIPAQTPPYWEVAMKMTGLSSVGP